ncbi:MAG: hypothetical protein C5S49_06905 [Candidatus Methanogaster sp.]|nr:MAG: hypothetical protein C5S49_06905 [ANME-2 cluster archaeon]
MNEKRIARYVSKIQLIEERIGDIQSWECDFTTDKRSRLAVYKAMQEIVEASMDVLAMRLKDSEKLPMDDYTNIDRAYKAGIIDERIKYALEEANGLRNRLVHGYNGINETVALESMKVLFPLIEAYIERMRQWLKELI